MFNNINKLDNMNEYQEPKEWNNDEESEIELGE